MAGPLKQYEVEVGGTRTSLMLTDEDAKARGLTVAVEKPSEAEAKQAATPPNKARRAPNKSATPKA